MLVQLTFTLTLQNVFSFLELSVGRYSWVSSNGLSVTLRDDFSLLKRWLYSVSSTKKSRQVEWSTDVHESH
jgi:hypothetical protein